MPVTKLYLSSPSKEIQARITSVQHDNNSVRLDKTIFHPQGGGQKSDAGMINSTSLKAVKHAPGGEVDHIVEDINNFQVGDIVILKVEPRHREISTLYHSAGHLIADAMTKIRPSTRAVQGHHWPGEARVEFDGGSNDDMLFHDLETCIQEFIDKDISFTLVGDPFKNRAIKIGNFKEVGCGGTHVVSAGELKGLSLIRIKTKKNRLRVSYEIT